MYLRVCIAPASGTGNLPQLLVFQLLPWSKYHIIFDYLQPAEREADDFTWGEWMHERRHSSNNGKAAGLRHLVATWVVLNWRARVLSAALCAALSVDLWLYWNLNTLSRQIQKYHRWRIWGMAGSGDLLLEGEVGKQGNTDGGNIGPWDGTQAYLWIM